MTDPDSHLLPMQTQWGLASAAYDLLRYNIILHIISYMYIHLSISYNQGLQLDCGLFSVIAYNKNSSAKKSVKEMKLILSPI